jgi:demethylmacrocin O-methyltransferase
MLALVASALVVARVHSSDAPPQDTRPTLHTLALEAGTDKATEHLYTLLYEPQLARWRDATFDMLEIGVFREESLRLWDRYFRNASVYGADRDGAGYRDSSRRSRILYCDQSKPASLRTLANYKNWSIVIDDGSHVPSHQLRTFETIFPHVMPGGLYIIEDIEGSYWGDHARMYGVRLGTGNNQPNLVDTFLRSVHGAINREFACDASLPPRVFSPRVEREMVGVAFIPNAIIITKRPANYQRHTFYRFADALPRPPCNTSEGERGPDIQWRRRRRRR